MSDWDAERYHRLSDPQLSWGRRVLARLGPTPGERILDVGCGTGRLTVDILLTMGRGSVVGVDSSAAMLTQAALLSAEPVPGPHDIAQPPGRVHFVRADGAELPFAGAFDAVFSTAAFHWIRNHAQLFASIYDALAPGGRLVAQCGGGPNLSRLLERAHRLMEAPEYRAWFDGWSDPWYFADVPRTLMRLEAAGFSRTNVSLEPAPTTLPDADAYTDFLSCVCVRHHVARLPQQRRPAFLAALAREAAADDPPFTLDYWTPAGAEPAA